MKNLIAALALSAIALTGCAEEDTTVVEPIAPEAEVVTEPIEEPMMMEADSTTLADSTMMEGEVMEAAPEAEGVEL